MAEDGAHGRQGAAREGAAEGSGDKLTPAALATSLAAGAGSSAAGILQLAASVAATAGCDAFMLACRLGQSDLLQLMVLQGADVNRAVEDGATGLTLACREGHAGCVRVLLDSRADVAVVQSDGLTPLVAACRRQSADCIRLLLERGNADPNQSAGGGTTALMAACQGGHT